MRTILSAFIVLAFSINLFAQDSAEEQIKELYDNEDYNTIIKDYTSNNIDYSANSLFYIGSAYMMLEDDANCIKYMDLSIAKDSINPASFYTKASSFLYMGMFEESIPIYLKAISLDSNQEKLAKSYSGLGAAYYYLTKPNLALEAYNKAIEYDMFMPTPYLIVAQIYSDMNQKEKALEVYYEAKQNTYIYKETNEYATILFNIGLMEQLRENYKESESAFRELVSIHPNDYHAHAKLIQMHYHNKEYDKAIPLKEKLYTAHKEELLDENLSDMFCIDQFKWKGKSIKVFERYEEGDKPFIYNKLLFYIIDKEDNIEYRIQTEYSPAAVTFGEAKYILCANKDNSHINYGIGFNDDSSYESIKNAVISVLEKEQQH